MISPWRWESIQRHYDDRRNARHTLLYKLDNRPRCAGAHSSFDYDVDIIKYFIKVYRAFDHIVYRISRHQRYEYRYRDREKRRYYRNDEKASIRLGVAQKSKKRILFFSPSRRTNAHLRYISRDILFTAKDCKRIDGGR